VTVLVLVQALLVMVHWNVLAPELRPLTVELKSAGELTVPAPETVLQTPVPTEGLLAESVAVDAQTAWFPPAMDVVGKLLTIKTSSKAEQPSRLTVQR